MENKFPEEKELKKVAEEIRLREFVYLASFANAFNRYFKINLRKDNANLLTWGTLSLLIIKGGSITPTNIAKLLFRSKHSVTKIIDSLEKDNFIVRDSTNADRRQKNIRITEDGVNFIVHSLVRADEVWRPIVSSLNGNENKELLRLTETLRRRMIEEIQQPEQKKGKFGSDRNVR